MVQGISDGEDEGKKNTNVISQQAEGIHGWRSLQVASSASSNIAPVSMKHKLFLIAKLVGQSETF